MGKKTYKSTIRLNSIIKKLDDNVGKLYELDYSELNEEDLIELGEDVEGYIDTLQMIKIDVDSLRGIDSKKIGLSEEYDVENKKGIIIY
jgi:hypothetical protein